MDNAEKISAKWQRMQSCEADKEEVRQLAAIAKWQAEQAFTPGRASKDAFINLRVTYGIRNGMRDWLQLRKTDKPRRMAYYSTTTDKVE